MEEYNSPGLRFQAQLLCANMTETPTLPAIPDIPVRPDQVLWRLALFRAWKTRARRCSFPLPNSNTIPSILI